MFLVICRCPVFSSAHKPSLKTINAHSVKILRLHRPMMVVFAFGRGLGGDRNSVRLGTAGPVNAETLSGSCCVVADAVIAL